MAERSDVPWKSKSRSEEGRVTEKKLLKARGARVHPNSGAGSIKEDGSDEDHLYEVKDTRKSFTLNAKDLQTSYIRGLRQGKQAVWLIKFSDCNLVAEIRLLPGNGETNG